MTKATTTSTRRRSSRLTAAAALALLVNVGLGIAQSDARPMIQPCSYDNTCITTTIRR